MKNKRSAVSGQRSASGQPPTSGFTLIEMLVVIAIIGILAGLLFPAIKGAMTKAKSGQARNDVKAIENAIRQYYTEYGKLPVRDADQGIGDFYYTASDQYQIINTLRAVASGWNASHALNPRRIVFYEPPSRKGAVDGSGNILDPWQQVYYIKLDNNYDGTVDYGSRVFQRLAVLVSYGPNKNQDFWNSGSDDIVSTE